MCLDKRAHLASTRISKLAWENLFDCPKSRARTTFLVEEIDRQRSIDRRTRGEVYRDDGRRGSSQVSQKGLFTAPGKINSKTNSPPADHDAVGNNNNNNVDHEREQCRGRGSH
jgi:hypothetical protein